MEVKHIVFEKLLENNNLKKTDFAKYSKIPYFTVAGWKKRDSVPPYAMVILKDMIYRKKLDMEAEQTLRRINCVSKIDYSLTATEENKLKSVFWGTNYTIDDIAKEIQHNNLSIIKRVEENLPLDIRTQIISKLAHA
jgi:hypothetical protein